MKLLLDEMHAPTVAALLRDRGHDAVAVKERADLVGMSDEDVLRVATAESRAVVTEDLKHFAVLHQHILVAGQRHSGLILTMPAGSLAPRRTMGVCWPMRSPPSSVSTGPCSTASSRSYGGSSELDPAGC